MSSSESNDGRMHIKSDFMRESLVSKSLNESTEKGTIRRMVPDVHFFAFGGQSIMDRGSEAILPLVDKIVELKQNHKFVLGVGGGARIRHTYAIGRDLGLPVGGLARIMGGVEEQNRDMLQFLLAPHGGITFIKDHFQDLQMFLQGGLIPVCIGQPPYHIWEPPPVKGHLPENGADVGLFLMAEMMGAASMTFVKDVDGVFTDNPHKNKDAELIKDVSAAELKAMNLPDLPIETEMLNCLETSRLVREVHVINGLDPDNMEKLLNGEHVGTRIRGRESDNLAQDSKAGGAS